MPLLVALHVTGPFARVAVLPETLNFEKAAVVGRVLEVCS